MHLTMRQPITSRFSIDKKFRCTKLNNDITIISTLSLLVIQTKRVSVLFQKEHYMDHKFDKHGIACYN